MLVSNRTYGKHMSAPVGPFARSCSLGDQIVCCTGVCVTSDMHRKGSAGARSAPGPPTLAKSQTPIGGPNRPGCNPRCQAAVSPPETGGREPVSGGMLRCPGNATSLEKSPANPRERKFRCLGGGPEDQAPATPRRLPPQCCGSHRVATPTFFRAEALSPVARAGCRRARVYNVCLPRSPALLK